MSVTAVCTGCQKTFKAPDDFAGKKVRCKNCGTAFRVPGGQAVAAAASPAAGAAAAAATPKRQPVAAAAPKAKPAVAAAKRTAPKPVEPAFPDDGEYGLSQDDVGLHAQEAIAAARPYNPSSVAATPAYAAPAATTRGATLYPTTGTTVAARHGGAAPTAGLNWLLYVQLGAFGFPLLLLLIGKLIPAMATAGILMATFVGIGFMFWGQIGILITAGNESLTCLLLYLFIPLYPIYFILTRLEDVMPYLIRTIAGFALMFGAIMMILSQSPK